MLIRHTERILTAAHGVLSKRGRPRVFRAVKEVGLVVVRLGMLVRACVCVCVCMCVFVCVCDDRALPRVLTK
jgi:hypothetical protein